jgi:hypothetical protein
MKGLSEHEKNKHFNMQTWSCETECGTTMCAAGFAASDRWFNIQGFTLYAGMPFFEENGRRLASWSAIFKFFDGVIDDNPFFNGQVHPVFTKPQTVEEVIEAAEWRIFALQRWGK